MNEAQKLLLTLGAFGLLVVGLLVWMYMHLATIGWGPFEGRESLSTRIRQQQQALRDARARIDQIEPTKQELRKLERDQRTAAQLLPTESTPDVLLYYIHEKAKEAGVQMRSITPTRGQRRRGAGGRGRGGEEQLFEEWTYEMELVGDFDQIGRFINMMEEFQITTEAGQVEERFFAVKDISIEGAAGGLTENGRHTVGLVMQTFRYTGEDAPAGER